MGLIQYLLCNVYLDRNSVEEDQNHGDHYSNGEIDVRNITPILKIYALSRAHAVHKYGIFVLMYVCWYSVF